MDEKPGEIHEILINTKVKQTYHTVLTLKLQLKTQIYLITSQQVPSGIVDTCLHMDKLEYVTKGHLAMHKIFLNFKQLYSLVS